MHDITVNFDTEHPVSFDVKAYIQDVLNNLDIKSANLEYTFLGPEAMISINRTHLNHDYATDIITFDLSESESDGLMGDLYICLDEVAKNAIAMGNEFDNELKIVIIHGILHLLGYDDQTDEDFATMDARQLEIFNQVQNREA